MRLLSVFVLALGLCMSVSADDKKANEKAKEKKDDKTVVSPRDAQSGQASGKRQHAPAAPEAGKEGDAKKK